MFRGLNFNANANFVTSKLLIYILNIIPSMGSRDKRMVFSTPMMNFAFLDMVFRGNGLEIDTYKPQNVFDHISHVVNTR